MADFTLPFINLKIESDSERLQHLVSHAFALCSGCTNDESLHVRAQAEPLSSIVKNTPRWLQKSFDNGAANVEPRMIYDSQDRYACIGRFDEDLFCAWTDSTKSKIQYRTTQIDGRGKHGYFHAVLIPLLRELYIARNLLLVHAAGIAFPQGNGALFIAPSGGGKTTTALALARLGARLIADDLIVLTCRNASTIAYGIPKLLNIRPSTKILFPELNEIPETDFQNIVPGKQSIAPDAVLGNDCMISHCSPRTIYFLRLSSSGPSRRRLSISESIRRFALAQAFCRNQRLTGPVLASIVEALSCCSCYELATGMDPVHLAEWILAHENSRPASISAGCSG